MHRRSGRNSRGSSGCVDARGATGEAQLAEPDPQGETVEARLDASTLGAKPARISRRSSTLSAESARLDWMRGRSGRNRRGSVGGARHSARNRRGSVGGARHSARNRRGSVGGARPSGRDGRRSVGCIGHFARSTRGATRCMRHFAGRGQHVRHRKDVNARRHQPLTRGTHMGANPSGQSFQVRQPPHFVRGDIISGAAPCPSSAR
jgi:hypothetical protein